jgi:hypothetical protein
LPRGNFDPSTDRAIEVDAWRRSWRFQARIVGADTALAFELSPITRKKMIDFHWQKTLELCAGLDSSVSFWDPEQLRPRNLLELLRVKRPWRQPGPIEGPRIEVSEQLSGPAIERACRYGLSPLSAFSLQAWSCLRDGWELQEHPDRLELRAERDLELETVRSTYDEPTAHAKIGALLTRWAMVPAEHRARHWRGWWQQGEA